MASTPSKPKPTPPTPLSLSRNEMLAAMSTQLSALHTASLLPSSVSGITDEQVAQLSRTFTFLHGSFFRAAEANKKLGQLVALPSPSTATSATGPDADSEMGKEDGMSDDEDVGAATKANRASVKMTEVVRRSKDEKIRDRAIKALNERLEGLALPKDDEDDEEEPSVAIGKFV